MRNRSGKSITEACFKDEEFVKSLKAGVCRYYPMNVYNDSSSLKMCNHLDHNYHLGNKKALFYNLREYCEK